MENSAGQRFRKRSGIIAAGFLFWGFLSISFVFYFSVIRRDGLREQARMTAWRQGEFPALRGTVFSSEGKILAESKLEFLLFWESGKAGKSVSEILGRPVVSGCAVTEKELAEVERIVRNTPFALRIESREKRISALPPGKLGEIERKYDHVLRGRNGLFVVMLDRFGRLVPGTMKIIREESPGKSVVLTREEESRL